MTLKIAVADTWEDYHKIPGNLAKLQAAGFHWAFPPRPGEGASMASVTIPFSAFKRIFSFPDKRPAPQILWDGACWPPPSNFLAYIQVRLIPLCAKALAEALAQDPRK
jgi:hypothetical protein